MRTVYEATSYAKGEYIKHYGMIYGAPAQEMMRHAYLYEQGGGTDGDEVQRRCIHGVPYVLQGCTVRDPVSPNGRRGNAHDDELPECGD